jgi:hypothetical protein
MANCMMGFPNRADKATLSGGAWTAGLPRVNLQDRVIGRVARTSSAALASTQFDMDMGPSGKARALSLRKHNMSLAAKYRVRATSAAVKTNLLAYPRNFDNAAWVKGRAVVLPNIAVAPSGAMTADKLVEDTSNGGHYVEQSPTIVGVNTYERSVFIKAAEKKKAHLAFFSSPTTTSFAVVIFNTTTGAFEGPGLGGSATQTYSAVAYPDGWWLLKQTVTLGSADTSCFCRVTLLGAGETTVGYAGDGASGLYIWHMQLVPGAQPSAIIPDTTAFVSRAGIKNEFNAGGALTQYAAGAAVTAYDPVTQVSRGVSLEAAATNAIRNNTMVGAVGGTPGTLPTNWQFQSAVAGVSYSVVAAGTEDGIDYMDIRFFGTVTTAGGLNIRPDAYPYPTSAAVGQNWVSSAFFKLVAGSFSGVTSHYFAIEETSSSDVYLSGAGYARPIPSGAALKSQRAAATRQLTSATTTKVGGYIGVSVSLGADVDFTLRIGLPQMEQGAFATSPIKTTGAAVTRSADISVSPQGTLPAGYMDDLQPATYDSDWQDVWPTVYPFGTLEWGDENWWSGKYTTEEAEGYIAELVHILPADRYERWWRIEFDDQTNAAGFIEIGRLFIGPVWQPKINMEYGASIGWETTTEARQAISGAEYFSDGINFRVQRFTLGHMDQDEAFSQAFELQRRAGISGEILWIHDPDDTVHALRRRYLARMRQLSAIDYPYFGANSTAFELKELL